MGDWNDVVVKYTLVDSLVALDKDNVVTVIPTGAVVEAPAWFAGRGSIEVLYAGLWMKVLAIDLIDAGIRAGTSEARMRKRICS